MQIKGNAGVAISDRCLCVLLVEATVGRLRFYILHVYSKLHLPLHAALAKKRPEKSRRGVVSWLCQRLVKLPRPVKF